ncbi:uncharacterized protein LOC119728981 [Patiria miniata]|uniref:Dendritic cell-specific transmembrane protein-like domain-containing protein n=1 Tax=Patiria miniata TaxID=46514 RepID=A0A914A166_PATMI|nr:uncharacterized protein LOC119728981 [Patiria miniata]
MSTALKVKLERSLSQPRVRDDNDVRQDENAEPHPGHRYYTPQPDCKKPQLLPKPGVPTPSKTTISPQINESDTKPDTIESPAEAARHDEGTKEAEDREKATVPNGHVPADKQTGAPNSARLKALRAASTMEPLTPRRKAPSRPPLGKRRTSDTQLQVIEQLMKRNESFNPKASASLKRGSGNKVSRSASSAGLLSASPDRRSRPQFLTPQPTRRKFNLVDRTPSVNDGSPIGPVARLAQKTKRLTSQNSWDSAHSSDPSPSPSPHTPVSPLAAPAFKAKKMTSPSSADSGQSAESSPSPTPHTPVSPLALPAFKTKKLNSQQSSDSGLSPDLSSSPSPHTPVSPLAAPAFIGRVRQSVRPAPPVPDSQQRNIDFHQWKGPDKEKQWTKPEKSHSGTKDAISRNRPISMPNNIRRVSRGSVNKSKQRQSTVRQQVAARQLASTVTRPASPAIGRSTSTRHRHQSAPAGRVALALKHDPTGPVTSSLTGGEAPLNTTISTGIRRRHASDSLRKEVLRSVSMERSRKMSLMSDEGRGLEEVTPLGKADNDFREEMIRLKTGLDQPDMHDSSTRSLNGSTKASPRRFVSADNRSVYSDYPSTFTNSPGPSPTRQRPKLRRGRSSRTSLGSFKSMLASNEFLNDIFLSDRKSHRKLKGIVGALAGLVLGCCLFLGVYYGLEYSLIASIVITVVATIIMCLSLALTVRARCVAALMVPTLCTSRGRAAFLAVIVTLLLTGPIDNIYTNAKVASESMSCSAELAKNQTKLIQDAAKEIFDVYVRNLMDSVRKLQDAAEAVHDAFRPVENVLNEFVQIIGNAGEALRAAASMCRQIINGAYKDCSTGVNIAYKDCRAALGQVPDIGSARLDEVCNLLNFGQEVCGLLRNADGICEAPTLLDDLIDTALKATQGALEDLRRVFDTDVDFETYWENRQNQSQSFESIQGAIQQELEDSLSFLNSAFSIVDKIVALSVLFLLFRSYKYHSKYRTKDRFDNYYVTKEFKLLDEKRQESGRDPILPLKKSERRRLIDLSSVLLSKPEKGLFKLGMVTVLLHVVIAAVLVLADYGLFWLLSLISRHGKVKFEISGGGGTDLTIGGTGVLSQLIQSLFVEGFAAASEFNVSLDTEHCLPNPNPPNENLSIGIGVLYLIAILMVLSQAYALRLRRRIASYFYPERELERINFLYNHTLQRRQNLFKLLKQRIRQTKHEMDVEQRVSFVAYLSAKYPCWRKVFRFLGQEKRVCLGCADVDNGTFKSCGNPDCRGLYCRECLHEIGNTCTLCQEIVVGSDMSIGVVENRV